MVRLVLASRNQGKISELRQMLQFPGWQLESLIDWPLIKEIAETGKTFQENAMLKAQAVMQATGLIALADDSGLEVDALRGAPGVHSARYAGIGATDQQRIELLLKKLIDVPAAQRTARFRCVMALIDPKHPDHFEIREGCCEGLILFERRGSGGFGYDPVFWIEELGKTFAEALPEEKNKISHRGQAVRKMVQYLREKMQINQKDSCI